MHIAIIGNGISGITAARFIRKLSDYKITVISSESDHFYSRTALMYIYMGHMRYEDTKPYEDWFWEKNRIEIVRDYVLEIKFDDKKLHCRDTGMMSYDKLIIATGSKSNKFGWPGQDLKAVTGLYGLEDLEIMEQYSEGLERAVVVGGGLIGIEMAEMFHSRDIPVTILSREESYWNNVLPPYESEMVSDYIDKNHIDLRLGVNLEKIIDDGNGRAAGVIVKETGEQIDCGFVGLTPGVSPNLDILKDTAIKVDKGVIVNEYLETNIEDVYAIGDCVQRFEALPNRPPIEAVWYTGRIMGETVAHTICGNKTAYQPGIWFNSAKFIDIEYQVYGQVPNNCDDLYSCVYWQNDNKTKSIRITFDEDSKAVQGFLLMGVRYRQEVCEKWIKNEASIEDVLKDLKLANFDPEFYEMYESELIDNYNKKYDGQIKLQSKRNLNSVLSFLNRPFKSA